MIHLSILRIVQDRSLELVEASYGSTTSERARMIQYTRTRKVRKPDGKIGQVLWVNGKGEILGLGYGSNLLKSESRCAAFNLGR